MKKVAVALVLATCIGFPSYARAADAMLCAAGAVATTATAEPEF